MRTIELLNGKGVALVDDEDYDRLSQRRWSAVAGRTKHIGSFKTELEAALAYDTFVLAHFDEFAAPNVLHRVGSAVTVRLRCS